MGSINISEKTLIGVFAAVVGTVGWTGAIGMTAATAGVRTEVRALSKSLQRCEKAVEEQGETISAQNAAIKIITIENILGRSLRENEQGGRPQSAPGTDGPKLQTMGLNQQSVP